MTEKNRAGKGHPDDAALQEKRRLAGEIIERLEKEYPDAGCTLDYDDAWKLLVSVRLAAQCTDARVNVVVEKLYEKFPDVEALAAADPEEIEELVRPCGLGKSKARDISAANIQVPLIAVRQSKKIPSLKSHPQKAPADIALSHKS